MNSFDVEIAKAIAATGAFDEETAQKLLTIPGDTEHGNFSLPCFALAKTWRKAPKLIAEELAPKIQLPNGVSKVEAVAGYLNFFIDRDFLAKSILGEISEKGLNYGHAESNGKTVCIDYSSPNIGKELAFHHLRSTMIGNSLARIYKASGYKVERINHLGDWGTAFGKLIVMYLREKRPSDDATLESLTVKELNVLYASFSKAAETKPSLEDEARKAFSELEKGNSEYHRLWLAFRAATLKELMRIYKMMGVEFDHYTGESFYEDKMPAVIEELKEKKLLERSEERDVVKLDEYKLNPCLIRKSDGSTLYATRDLAAALYRKKEYNFDKCLYVVDLGQALHFKQIKLVLKKMGREWYDTLVHIPFGVILNLIDGKWEKGKTRTGKAKLLRDVIEAATKKILEYINQKNPDLENKELIAEQIGISALTFNDLKNHRLMDVKFDWDSALSFEGATGPYVQNAHVRLCSIMRKAGYEVSAADVDFSQLHDDNAYELVKVLGKKAASIRQSVESDEPCILAQYALDIAGAAHKFIHEDRVLGSPEEKSRLFLVKCTQAVLEDVLDLLGLFPVRNM